MSETHLRVRPVKTLEVVVDEAVDGVIKIATGETRCIGQPVHVRRKILVAHVEMPRTPGEVPGDGFAVRVELGAFCTVSTRRKGALRSEILTLGLGCRDTLSTRSAYQAVHAELVITTGFYNHRVKLLTRATALNRDGIILPDEGVLSATPGNTGSG